MKMQLHALAGNNGNDSLDGGGDTDACSGGSGNDTAANCEASAVTGGREDGTNAAFAPARIGRCAI